MSDPIPIPATERLEALHRAADEARERRDAIRERERNGGPVLDLLRPMSAELEAAERDVEAAADAVTREAREGEDARWQERLRVIEAEEAAYRAAKQATSKP